MVIDLILSSGSIIASPYKCETECPCDFITHDERDAAADRALQRLKEGNSLYYTFVSPSDRHRHHLRRVGDLRQAAQFPELKREKAQRHWLEAEGIQLMEAMQFMSSKLNALHNSCVQYLHSSAARARFKITLRNGLTVAHCLEGALMA